MIIMNVMWEKFITYIYVVQKKARQQPPERQILHAGLAAALLFELLSLPFLGFDIRFLYGLALGTAVAVVNLKLLRITAEWVLSHRWGPAIAVAGYMLRLLVYGAAFLTAYRLGTASGIGSLLGFVTLKLGILYAFGFGRTRGQ